MLSLALIKCDIMSDLGVLSNPWCNDHDSDETEWVLLKISKMRDEIEGLQEIDHQ